MTPVKTKDFLKRLFSETQEESNVDSDLDGFAHLWEEMEEESKAENKQPLLKALKELGIDADEKSLKSDPSGFSLSTEDSDEFSVMKDVLLKPSKLHTLAELGWVAYVCGDEGETEEPRKYTVKFLELDLNPTDFEKKADKEVPTSMEDSEKKLEKIIKTSREVEMGEKEKEVPMGKKNTGVAKTKEGEKVKHAIKDSKEVSRLISNLLKEEDEGDEFDEKWSEIQELALSKGLTLEAEMDTAEPFVVVKSTAGEWDAPITDLKDLKRLETLIRETR